MEVRTPYLPLPIEVRGIGPHRVEQHGCCVMVCDEAGNNSVTFNFDHAEVAAKEGVEASRDLLRRVPVWSCSILRNDRPEYVKLCGDVAEFLNQQRH